MIGSPAVHLFKFALRQPQRSLPEPALHLWKTLGYHDQPVKTCDKYVAEDKQPKAKYQSNLTFFCVICSSERIQEQNGFFLVCLQQYINHICMEFAIVNGSETNLKRIKS